MNTCNENCSKLFDVNNNQIHDWDNLVLSVIYKLASLFDGSLTFVDIGANKGVITREVSQMDKISQVFAIEPNADTFKQLLHTLTNNIKVKCMNLAVSDVEGEIELYSGNGSSETCTILKQNSVTKAVVNTVKCATLDFIKRKINDRFDIIKIDVEGAELNVLQGAADTINNCKFAIVEVHSVENFSSLLTLAKTNNWVIKCLKNLHTIDLETPTIDFCYQVVLLPAGNIIIE